MSRKLKRKYEKKKHKSGSSVSGTPAGYHPSTTGEVVDVMEYGSTEDEPLSPVSIMCSMYLFCNEPQFLLQFFASCGHT